MALNSSMLQNYVHEQTKADTRVPDIPVDNVWDIAVVNFVLIKSHMADINCNRNRSWSK